MPRARFGIDVFLATAAPGRYALVTNHAAVTSDGRRNIDALRDAGVDVRCVLAPEHGFWADLAYMVDVPPESYRDAIPMHSLYSSTREEALAPTPEQLDGVDHILFDLQDVGSRYFTYVATGMLTMRVAKRLGIPVTVLDRPNPIGGELVEGGLVEPGFESFVGAFSVPIRHGLTAGELLQYLNAKEGIGCDLRVIAARGWRRDLWWEETNLPWVYPSPNMARPSTAAVYPGMCLWEGTNVSEGRGTTQPFEVFGAPWLDEHELEAALNGLGLPGVRFVAHVFTPTASKFAGERCRGVFVVITDRELFEPVRTGLWCVKTVRDLRPSHFEWYLGEYEFSKHPAIDALTGSDRFRKGIVGGGGSLEGYIRDCRAVAEEFRRESLAFRLREYERPSRWIEAPESSIGMDRAEA